MNNRMKVIATFIVIAIVGFIVTVLYETNGNLPGDGPVGFVLFATMIIAIYFIWQFRPPKKGATKSETPDTDSNQEVELEVQQESEKKDWNLDIENLFQKYVEEYSEIERKLDVPIEKKRFNFIGFEYDLGEKYRKKIVEMEEKYPEAKNQLFNDFHKRVVDFNFKKNTFFPSFTVLKKEQTESSKKRLEVYPNLFDFDVKARVLLNQEMSTINADKSISNKKSTTMGQYSDLLYSSNPMSIASTVKSIVSPLREFGFAGTRDKTEAMSAFQLLLGQRAQAAMIGGATRGNYLLDTGMHMINAMYEECFIVDTDKYTLDLPLFVSAAMFLDSSVKRESLRAGDSVLNAEYFECIYTVCKQLCPFQIQFSSNEAIEVMNRFNQFLLRRYSR